VDYQEFDDEAEFEKVVQAYNLHTARVLDDGNLLTPSGAVAAHRSLYYIYKQRGVRKTPDEIGLRTKKALLGKAGYATRLALCGGFRGNNNQLARLLEHEQVSKVALSRAKKDGKHVMAVLRRKQKGRMEVGIQQNKLNLRFGNRGAIDYC